MSLKTWALTCGRVSINADVSPRDMIVASAHRFLSHRLPRCRRQVAPEVPCQEAFDVRRVARTNRLVGIQEVADVKGYFSIE